MADFSLSFLSGFAFLKPTWNSYRGLYLGWGAGKLSKVFDQVQQYFGVYEQIFNAI